MHIRNSIKNVVLLSLLMGFVVGCCIYKYRGVAVTWWTGGGGVRIVQGELVSAENCKQIRERSQSWKPKSDDPYNDADHIIDNIYLGNVCAAHNESWLVEHKIGIVVNMALEWATKNISYTDDIIYISRTLDDTTSQDGSESLDYLNSATDDLMVAIERVALSGGNNNVLVHCNMGISRSTSVVISYMQRKHAMSYDQAYRHIKERRPVARPNRLFERLLRGDGGSEEKENCIYL